MARPLRLEYVSAFCDVTSRGNEQKNVFRLLTVSERLRPTTSSEEKHHEQGHISLKSRMKGVTVGDLQAALQLFLDRGLIQARDEGCRQQPASVLQGEHTEQTYGKHHEQTGEHLSRRAAT
jgi:hypothetical protein